MNEFANTKRPKRPIKIVNVLITGGTGFIGRALIMRLMRDGHSISALVRNQGRASSLLGEDVKLLAADLSDSSLDGVMSETDVVVNLAGEPVLGGRWTPARKKSIWDSRIDLTNRLVDSIQRVEKRPQVLLSSSAVGFYGDGGDRKMTSDDQVGRGFLAELCAEWESAALRASTSGVRVVMPRTGFVLGRGGGALKQMLTPFRLGVGGPIGSGEQYIPWIHLDDIVEMMVTAIQDEQFEGPFNATGPDPVTFKEFARVLGKVLKRPAILPLPGFVVHAIFGDAAEVILTGQRAIPQTAQKAGYTFRHTSLESALQDLLSASGVRIRRITEPVEESSEYLKKRPPTYLLEAETIINRPVKEIFPFFSSAGNLGLITPPEMNFAITGAPKTMEEGAIIDYTLKVNGIGINWQTRIEKWESGSRFVDSQSRGPYASWWHEHAFIDEGDRTRMTDRVYYSPPAGILGRIANEVFIADELKRVFGYRASVIRLRFGD
jgi:uncharacterized protein (TIGR01777 family)